MRPRYLMMMIGVSSELLSHDIYEHMNADGGRVQQRNQL